MLRLGLGDPLDPAKVVRHHIHHPHLEYAASAVPAHSQAATHRQDLPVLRNTANLGHSLNFLWQPLI